MSVIRPIFDDVTPADRDAVAQVRRMLREKFPDMREEGGYRTRTIGRNAHAFSDGLAAGAGEARLWL